MTRVNLLEELSALEAAAGAGRSDVARYAADLLGRIIGHAIETDTEVGPWPWTDYKPIMAPALAGLSMPLYVTAIAAVAEVSGARPIR